MFLAAVMGVTTAVLITGCASSSDSSTAAPGSASTAGPAKTGAPQFPALPASVTLHKDNDIQGV